MGWPKYYDVTLKNQNRGGFYVSNLRLKSTLEFDSSFYGVLQGNLYGADIQDAYLVKDWMGYEFKLGKFIGAGLHSAHDEYDTTQYALFTPLYARAWQGFKKLFHYRDYGIQAEKISSDGELKQRLFIHNASGQNVINDEPNNYAAPPAQVLGIDYAVDYKFSQFSTIGGHIGAQANQEWEDFFGRHGWYKVQYWFKTNSLLDGSAYHQFNFPHLNILNEFMVISNRNYRVPPDSAALKTWGLSSTWLKEHKPWLHSVWRYEFFDNTDGLNPDDALHMLTLGLIWNPAPQSYPHLKTTLEYTRVYEEGMVNRSGNDVLVAQLQHTF